MTNFVHGLPLHVSLALVFALLACLLSLYSHSLSAYSLLVALMWLLFAPCCPAVNNSKWDSNTRSQQMAATIEFSSDRKSSTVVQLFSSPASSIACVLVSELPYFD